MKLISLVLFLALVIELTVSSPLRVIKPNQGVKKIEKLDDAGKVTLSWEVNEVEGEIIFEIEAETLGYVGFGVSPQGSMEGADIFIAGVDPQGTPYSSDRHGTGFVEPVLDIHSDWTLLEAQEFNGITNLTYLRFSRLLNTCDDEDYPITNGTNRLIWAMGATDDLAYHSSDRRGSRSLSLLGPANPPVDLDETIEWEASVEMTMPGADTSYWCSLHKGPVLDKKHHIVALDAFLPEADSLKHTHHFTFFNCYLPADGSLDEAFENSTVDKGVTGANCYEPEPTVPFLGTECTEYFYVWAKGGKQMVYPENMGYPIGETDNGRQRYYKLEIHYDNPEKLEDVSFRTGVKIHYTDKLREIDAGQMMMGHQVNVAHLIPPNTTEFISVGHCHSDCTSNFPEGGINVFNVMLHSHLSGRKLKLRHFRDGIELPFLDYDDHYDFDYQQNKPLFQEVKILPGDQLAYECTYDSSWKKGEAVLGGLSTREEMCEVFMAYWPKQDVQICSSSYPLKQGFADLGITNYTEFYTLLGMPRFEVNEPLSLAGDFLNSMSYKFNWTKENVDELMNRRRYGQHETFCIKDGVDVSPIDQMVSYPTDLVEYVPDDVCDLK